MTHFFETGFAEIYGIEAAVLLHYIHYWVLHNRANETNYRDGRYWTYNSRAAFKKLFPYMSEWRIKESLSQLQKGGMILIGCYNEKAFDRTSWYTTTDECDRLYESIDSIGRNTTHRTVEIQPMEEECFTPPIPYRNTNNKVLSNESTDINNIQQSMFSSKDLNEEIDKNDIPTSNITTKTKKENKKFIPPTIDEVSVYCKERKNGIDAQSFINFYQSKGWMIGKNKMKDWRAAVRTWERNKNTNNYTRRERGIYESDEEDETPIPGLW